MPRRIIFSPLYEVGDRVYVIMENRIELGCILKRSFMDSGNTDVDMDNKIAMKQYNDPHLIDATFKSLIREPKIQYLVRHNIKNYESWLDEDNLYPDKEAIIQYIRDLPDMSKPLNLKQLKRKKSI